MSAARPADNGEGKGVPGGVTYFPRVAWVMLEGSNVKDHKGEVWIQIDDGEKFIRYRVKDSTVK